jgi:hypothetical protein
MISFTYQPTVFFTEDSPITIVRIRAGDSFGPKFYEYQSDKNLLVLVDSSFKRKQTCFIHGKMASNQEKHGGICFWPSEATHFSIEAINTITTKKLNNVGVLKGKSNPMNM